LGDVLRLLWGGVASDVPFLQNGPEVGPVADAVDDVIEDLTLSVGVVVVGRLEESLPE